MEAEAYRAGAGRLPKVAPVAIRWRRARTESTLLRVERLLDTLVGAGFGDEDAVNALSTITALVKQSLALHARALTGKDPEQAFWAKVAPDVYPRLAAAPSMGMSPISSVSSATAYAVR